MPPARKKILVTMPLVPDVVALGVELAPAADALLDDSDGVSPVDGAVPDEAPDLLPAAGAGRCVGLGEALEPDGFGVGVGVGVDEGEGEGLGLAVGAGVVVSVWVAEGDGTGSGCSVGTELGAGDGVADDDADGEGLAGGVAVGFGVGLAVLVGAAVGLPSALPLGDRDPRCAASPEAATGPELEDERDDDADEVLPDEERPAATVNGACA